jgi:predicted transcriptional regulator
MTRITSVRLEDDVADKLDALAKATDRPKGWLIEQAIKTYIEEQAWQSQAIREALEDYRSGKANLFPHEQVMLEMEEPEAEIKAALMGKNNHPI